MGWDLYTRAVLTLLIVLGMVVILSVILRRYGRGFAVRGSRRLGIIEVAALDARRRLVLIRRDTTEHLLLLGPSGDIVVESSIAPVATEPFARQLAESGP